MNFSLYKNRLIEYLNLQGIKAKKGLICCFSPNHEDKNPSCRLFDDKFICYSGSCGIYGDIYDAVEIIESITDKAEQFKRLEHIFSGDFIPISIKEKPKTEKKKFIPNPIACEEFDNYIMANKARKIAVKQFLSKRSFSASGGRFNTYPDNMIDNLVNYFGYFPGIDIARSELNFQTLAYAGIPTRPSPTSGIYSWGKAGVAIKLGLGYKLHFYEKEICEKRGSLSCNTFPMPTTLKGDEKKIILVEGEIDAIACSASGIENVYATGGSNGLTAPKIKKWLLNISEIIILFDSDKAGKKASGIVHIDESDKEKTSLPEKLRKAGFTGSIKIAQLKDYKDPDQAIVNRKLQLVIEAIDQAKEWEAITEIESESQKNGKKGILSLKELSGFLNKLKIDSLTKEELPFFCVAAINSTQSNAASVKEILKKWGVDNSIFNNKSDTPPSYLIQIAEKYSSYYYKRKFIEKTITKIDLEKKLENFEKPIVDINFSEIENDQNLQNFAYKRGEKSAANIIIKILKNRLIFVESKNRFYFYDSHTWKREPDLHGIIYNILAAILNNIISKTSEEDFTSLKALKIVLSKIEERKFRTAIAKDIQNHPLIFREDIVFDGPLIQETLTLIDSVMDFSGKELKFRPSTSEEHRQAILPYTTDEVKESTDPKKFLKFMNDNFTDKNTLETLFYFLSLIPSRNAQNKVGGIFVGHTNTGKTTTINILTNIYSEMITPMPRELIMNSGRNNFGTSGGLNPHLAALEGVGAAVNDETQRNDTLNAAMWKQLTGGGMLTARGLYAQPRKFLPTAQIIILTNFSPKFDNKDQATIDRMIIIPFNVHHNRGEKGTRDEKELLQELRPEFPAIIKFFSEYYILLKNKYKSKIPMSEECLAYKDDYVENQATDLDRFVMEQIEFVKDENCYETLPNIYKAFCAYNDIALDERNKPVDKTDKNCWSQNTFTQRFRGDYVEVRIKQKKINGYPIQIISNIRLKQFQAETEKIINENKPTENPFE